MQTEITLSYYDEAGRLKRVRVESKRFTIGRIPDNDLMIDNSSLSRRHALIESFDNSVQISDCGSSNGTFLNGSPVTYPVDLQDGDVINLADACELTVEFRDARAASSAGVVSQTNAQQQQLSHEELLRRVEAGLSAQSKSATPQASAPSSGGPAQAAPKVPFESPTSPEGLNVYIIAPVAAVVILALVVVAALAFRGGGSKKPERRNSNNQEIANGREKEIPNGSTLPTPDASVAVNSSTDPASDELDEVERNALAVMRSISKSDPNPVLTEQNVKEIDAKIKTYRGSAALRDNLRALKGRTQQLSSMAKGSDFKTAFVAFAALARMDRSSGDPVSVAQSILPSLSKARVLQGDELAHDILLTLISTDPSTGSPVALRDSISALTRQPNTSVQEIRNIWYLHENRKITPQAYDLALRLLAIGAIAQNPRKYGIEAEPITF